MVTFNCKTLKSNTCAKEQLKYFETLLSNTCAKDQKINLNNYVGLDSEAIKSISRKQPGLIARNRPLKWLDQN